MIFARDAVVLFLCLCTLSYLVDVASLTPKTTNKKNVVFGAARSSSSSSPLLFSAVPGADIEQEVSERKPQVVGNQVFYRGKVNEIDYCIAPSDVSLSRLAEQLSSASSGSDERLGGDGQESDNTSSSSSSSATTLSMTRYLNNASNRAVRRILLSRCWPSEEALNLSLRLAAAAEKEAAERAKGGGDGSTAKCPVPRPILNLLMRKGEPSSGGGGGGAPTSSSKKGPRTSAQYVDDQISIFRDNYGSVPGYDYAEAYLETVLNLATNGQEPPNVKNVMSSGVYDESYKRIKAVLTGVGAVFEEIPNTDRYQIANKLNDQDICLSIIDQIQMKNEMIEVGKQQQHEEEKIESSVPELQVEQVVEAKSTNKETAETPDEEESNNSNKRGLPRLRFWMKNTESTSSENVVDDGQPADNPEENAPQSRDRSPTTNGIILCADEPTMTRQLNALANIVYRALQSGEDQELLVLSETLFSNRDEFVDRWYPGTGDGPNEFMEYETRPGVQFLNALVLLLREAYDNGVVTSLEPSTALIPSFSNAYERLMATLVETGSGYVRPEVSNVMAMPKPRTAQEELGRFAVWESNFRSSGGETASYPEDLVGLWEVEDLVGGERIGVSTIVLEPQGEVYIAPPLQGLRWRLDPGPTHLDTCTFQVLSEEGTVLQYRGFLDRGARYESRFSGRSTKIRGSVMFQMRDGDMAVSDDYWKDMLPVNYKTGTTKFVMTKKTAQPVEN